jgi:hypothetical protein
MATFSVGQTGRPPHDNAERSILTGTWSEHANSGPKETTK